MTDEGKAALADIFLKGLNDRIDKAESDCKHYREKSDEKDSRIAELEAALAAEHEKYIKAEQAATVAEQAQTIIRLADEKAEIEAKLREAEIEIARLMTALEACRDGDQTPDTVAYKTPKRVATDALAGHKSVMQQRWEWQGERIQELVEQLTAAESKLQEVTRERDRFVAGFDVLIEYERRRTLAEQQAEIERLYKKMGE